MRLGKEAQERPQATAVGCCRSEVSSTGGKHLPSKDSLSDKIVFNKEMKLMGGFLSAFLPAFGRADLCVRKGVMT